MKLQRQPIAPGDALGRLGVEFSRLLCDDGCLASGRGGSKKSQESCGVDGRSATGLDAGSRMRQEDRAGGRGLPFGRRNGAIRRERRA